MDRLGSRCPLPSCVRPSALVCLLILTTSFLTLPTLRTLVLQLHSAVTGSYVSGTHSIVFVNCPNEQTARDIARAILDKKLAASVNILPKVLLEGRNRRSHRDPVVNKDKDLQGPHAVQLHQVVTSV
ncbi:protein CutA homolog isoform X4 [Tupaia chinensis]|uniref:protein CutA homolog isoform X4 n=1 Tax=Tupaia chinensis TaxID=246437 RepID=UPI0003C8DAD6|nr:protein CutA homolog isoform X4 [Tupaia chinensis]